jgi:DHA1 family inner membrane transport protein
MSLPDVSSEPATATRLPWVPLLVLSGAAFATVTTELLPASLLLELGQGLRVSESTAGLLVSAWALSLAASSVLLVRLTRRVPRRVLLPGALLLFAAATAGTALAPDYPVALATRIVAASAHGLFWALLIPATAAIVPAAAIGRGVAVVLAGPALAGVAGIPLGAAIGAGLGWRIAFGLLAVILVGAAVTVRRLQLPETPPAGSATGPAGRSRGSHWTGVLVVSAASGLVLDGHFALYTYIAPLLQLGGYGAGARAGLLLVMGLAGLGGIVVSGPLSDRFPRRALTGVVIVFVAGVALLGLAGTGFVVAALVLGFWGALIGVLPPVFQTRMLRLAPPDGQALAGAIGITVLNVGIAAGAALGGLIVSVASARSLPGAATAVVAAAAVVLLVGERPARPRS